MNTGSIDDTQSENDRNDTRIISEVLDGKVDAFHVVFERYGPAARYYFWNRCGEDRETAEDLTQEAFLRAYRSIRTFQLGSSFKKWFRTICNHLAIDHAKSLKAASLQAPAPPKAPPSCPAQIAVKRQIIEEALHLLSLRQREVFELKYVWDSTVEEVAQILGLPVGTVKTDLSQARKRLMEILEERSTT